MLSPSDEMFADESDSGSQVIALEDSEAFDQEAMVGVQALLAEIFETDAEEISIETQFGDLPKWDSMGHMDLMVALESQFGLEISAESISELISVPAILAHIQGLQSDS